MSKIIRWGILGTGTIAQKFAEALNSISDAEIAAVGSRQLATAQAFAERYGAKRVHGSYEDLADDVDVDVVYVATPHPMHKDNAILCLRAGKAVLCEKPITINAHETAELVRVAREEGQFLMEAMWTRFLPAVAQVKRWIEDAAIGEIRQIRADFGFTTDVGDEHRLLNPQLAGGSILDVGVYPISLAFWLFGTTPEAATGLACLSDSGVDAQSAYVLRFPKGGLAWLSSSVNTETPQDATILGTRGAIHIHTPFWSATHATLQRQGNAAETVIHDHRCNGYEYEAMHVMDCLRAGKRESDVMPLDESLAIMETCDALRTQWNIWYPQEQHLTRG